MEGVSSSFVSSQISVFSLKMGEIKPLVCSFLSASGEGFCLCLKIQPCLQAQPLMHYHRLFEDTALALHMSQGSSTMQEELVEVCISP